ncbi:MAG: exodeoxyribonuclease VII large subunit [Magnetococcales bacterium]|nr:exodeoxyribonuclease VII large subunit [Magnetococcales bacterium]
MSQETTLPWQEWLSVAELNDRIQTLLEESFPYVRVRGEISSPRTPSSGHCYFSLIDGNSRLRGVIWRTTLRRLPVPPREGDAVLITGRITCYPPRGEYQLVVEGLKIDGAGRERDRLMELHDRLQAEGLFEAQRKRPLPMLPQTIGVVTSSTGAAIHDITRVLTRRFPGFQLILAHARVQGSEAPAEIVHALESLNRDARAEVIICGRGGGSAQDLACFNAEIVARAIAASTIPVVSAVGHEVDLTLADLAADARASTPSAAAELIMPERSVLLERLATLKQRLIQAAGQQLHQRQSGLQGLKKRLIHPRRTIENTRMRLDEHHERLVRKMRSHLQYKGERLEGMRHRLHLWGRSPTFQPLTARTQLHQERLNTSLGHLLNHKRTQLDHLTTRLQNASPNAILGRGYAIVRDEEGRVIDRAAATTPGDTLAITLAEGSVQARVTHVTEAP